jgi:FlaA1/EpsC-like NDP-sugar epimerase
MVKALLFKSNTPRWLIFLIDIGIVAFSAAAAYMLRFNFDIPESELPLIKYAMISILTVRTLSFAFGKTYAGIIRYTSTEDARKILVTNFIGSLLLAFTNFLSFKSMEVFIIPFSIVIIEFLLSSFIMVTSRAFVKKLYEDFRSSTIEKNPVLIFGAGEAGMIAKRTIDRDGKNNFYVVGFIDDNRKKSKRKLENKPIFMGDQLEEVLEAKAVTHLIISPQNMGRKRLKEIIQICLEKKVQVLNVPSASKWINGELSVKQIRQVRIEDLLGREPIQLSTKQIETQLRGKTVLITGAAGSIGSEIVRLVIQYAPKKVLLVDQAESALYELEIELSTLRNSKCIEVIIGNVNHRERMEKVFTTFHPEIVYHAAAYKHVPLMENNPCEAIQTNILGSKIMADLANQYECEAFVMVSTDKAVNPTNVMGASKRIAEIYIQSLSKNSKTKYITTRFGNVLGSNGSVIPLFKKQIENGGPITVTHPDIRRYFMTIPEACQLVLEAGSTGKGGEVFVFDMGKSVKIKDLALQMIKLSGLEEGKDIQIVYSGLRPGEKLYEELLNDKENTLPTHHPQIMIAQVQEYSYQDVLPAVEKMQQGLNSESNTVLVAQMKKLVPEYKSNNSIYEELDRE